MNSFEELIQGHYRNQHQAMSNPAKWPQIDLRITKVGEKKLQSKSWYKYRSEANAYKHSEHTWEYTSDNTVIFITKDLLFDREVCSYIWTYKDGWWNGTTLEECIHDGVKVLSKARFNGIEYRAIDTGIDSKTGEFRWGKDPSEGEFMFKRIG
jgi:hypothetical protein